MSHNFFSDRMIWSWYKRDQLRMESGVVWWLPHILSCPLMFLFCTPVVRRVPPRFSIPPTNHEVMPGGSVNLTCVAVGAPMPYVKWLSGEIELTREEEMPIGRNVLELTNIHQSANYTCIAISSLGMIETTAQITVKGQRHCLWESVCVLESPSTVVKLVDDVTKAIYTYYLHFNALSTD